MKDLVGRSKNERKLDGIYNRQIKELIINKHKNEKRNSDIFLNLSKRSKNEDIPFPEIYEKDKKKKYMDCLKRNVEKNKKLECKDNNNIILEGDKEKNTEGENECRNNINNTTNSNSNSVVTIYKGIYMIIYKHIYSKNKFSKSLTIFINLCINYMNNYNKNIFFFAFDKIINTFNEKYLYNDNHDILKNNIYTFYNNNETHIKCMISFFDKVINKIIDNRFVINYTYEQNEDNTQKKENLQESLKGDENITSLKEQNIQTKQHSSRNDDLCEKDNTTHYTIVHITKEEKQFLKALKIKVYYIIILFKLNDNFIFNKLIGIYRQIFEEIQKEYNLYEHDETIQNNNNYGNNNNNNNNQDHVNDNDEIINNYFLFLKDKWILPNEYQIFKIKRKAFVKCLSNLYHFINVKWAKTSVESLLHDVYMKKFMFETCDQIIIENIQSSIKTNFNKRTTKFESSHVLSIGESLNPVVDAREEKIVSIHGSHIWSNKQMDR
ncbi:hypothetical protein PRSY57_0403600 [Plasmodium reichenowi]|uniref:Uncharacterized protein n=1 Tax=Plasmodium reichenowi TaxID=5854 RepID=A0A151LS77_PLARE|nr:hypothetical protein PRSY57_0403600 [Plasmodium reichenowi]KYO02043.1 hypothetical protein PRSY57_0403600 [Plasmodium reichenowi]